ncbi:MAG: hypothetical protein BMS9Abin04_432 [Planctomycetia bacterium]|nr:MAG: hypothetical protein BMS9Abin04_432 [Planctomycetia bacterium]
MRRVHTENQKRRTRPGAVWLTGGLLVLAAGVNAAWGQEPPGGREVIDGITTTRIVQGEPYELAGKRIVFTNWYYIQPGDLDWRNKKGESVYVHGDEGLFDAYHVGIRAPHGIRLVARKPIVVGPIDLPYRTILQHGGIYKGWTSTEYCESADGMHWPTKTQLVFDERNEDGVHHVFVDPVAPPAERFKAVWVGHISRAEFETFRRQRPDGWEPRALFLLGEKDQVTCLRGSVSPDGIRWTTLPDPLVVEYSDTLNTAYYDGVLKKYVLYTRFWSVGPRTDRLPPDIRNCWTGVGRRAIGRSESGDFRRFPPSAMILEPTPDMLPSEVLYTNCRTTVPGAPDHHLMFPAVWNASIDDTTRIVMASSHDGRVWHWVPGGDLLQTQPFGQWDGGCIWVNPELIELPNGSWALPYTGHNVPHKYPRGQRKAANGYAVWPKGRLVAVAADGLGQFTMIPIMAPGRVLKINAVTQRTGWVKAEVVGAAGRSLAECQPLVGDQHWTQLTWKDGSDLGVEQGRPITLKFELYQARLFGLEFE